MSKVRARNWIGRWQFTAGIVGGAVGIVSYPLAIAAVVVVYVALQGEGLFCDYQGCVSPIGLFQDQPGVILTTVLVPILGIVGAVMLQSRPRFGTAAMVSSGAVSLIVSFLTITMFSQIMILSEIFFLLATYSWTSVMIASGIGSFLQLRRVSQ